MTNKKENKNKLDVLFTLLVVCFAWWIGITAVRSLDAKLSEPSCYVKYYFNNSEGTDREVVKVIDFDCDKIMSFER